MILQMKNISKIYKNQGNEIKVVEDINLNIEKGSFVCILGHSGCGKTTLLNIIAGFENKTSGKVIINGEEVSEIGTNRIMMFQESALFPWLNVIENIEFGMKMNGMEKNIRRKRALKYLEMVNLKDCEKSYIHQLSGGMKQRVAIARALAMDSELLLMDEPFSALDTYTKTKLRSQLLNIWKESKKTILFVTHDVEEAVLMADKIIIMSSRPGKIIKEIDILQDRNKRKDDEELKKLGESIKREFGVVDEVDEE